MLNHVILIGRLTKDPELKYTPSGTAVASFTLAVDRFRKNADGEKEADFIPIIAWQKQAENCAEYLRKGSLAAVEGRINVRSYEDKEGKKRWVTEVVAEAVKFLSGKGDSAPKESKAAADLGFSAEDIPF